MQLKNLLRTYITLIGLLLGTAPALAQCDLDAGAIAFTGFRIFDDGVDGAEQDDEFSFVLLQHVEEGTTIYFTDLGWTDDDAFQSPEKAPSDGIIRWIAPEGGISAGTQVTIRCKYGLEASSGTVQSVLPNALGDGHVSLGIAGDQLFAFLGDVNSPQLLAAIGINISGWDSSLDADAVSSSRSVDAFTGRGDAIQHVTVSHIGGHAYNAVVGDDAYAGHADAIVAELNAVENWQISTVAYPDAIDEAFLLPPAGIFDIHPPTIDGQPEAQTACPEESVIFSVAATGACGYKWQFSADGETFTDLEDDARFTGADSPSLTINDTEELSGVYFRARVYGTAVMYSEAALLRVADAAPTVTAPEGEHEVIYGESTAFSVTGSEFVSVYQWQVSTDGGDSYTDLAEEGTFSGTDTHELHVGDSRIDMDGMQFRCQVTDICGRTAESAPVELRVARYVLTAGLTGGVTKTYDGGSVAELVAGNYTLSEALPDDEVQLVFPSNGAFNDKNAGEEKMVTVTGLALTGADAGNYALALTTISAPIGEIQPASLTIQAGDDDKVYGSADPVLTYSATGFVGDDDENLLEGALSREPGEDVDTYAIMQGTLDAGENYAITYTAADFTITPKSLTVTADAGQSKVYGSADPVLTYAATGFERDDDEDILAGALSREAGEDVDGYSIDIGTLVAGDNYTITYTGADFTITPKTLTVIAGAGQSKVYGSADPVLTYTATGFERDDDEDILAGVLSREAGEDVDRYAITQGTLDAGDNYTITYTGAGFTITRKSLAVTVDAGQNKVYGSADPVLTYAAIGFERDDDEDILVGALSREAGEDVDTYAITQGTLSAGANYAIAYTDEDFAITAKTLTVTADVGQSKVYGSADPTLTFEAAGFERDDDEGILGGTLSRSSGEDVNNYAITQGTLAAGSNYTISYTAADFTITPKTLAITADTDQSKVYGSADPVLTYAATGFEWDDDESILTGALSRAPGEGVDSYAITQGTLDAGDNYTITYTGAGFTITRKSLTVTAGSGQSKVYGSADPVLTYTATGFERDDDEDILAGVLSREAGEDVDTYAITQGTLDAGDNYTITYTGAGFTIMPKTLAVTADAGQNKVYGSADPVLTYAATGFERDDDEDILVGALSREAGEDVDTYAITQGTLSAGANYTITYTGEDFTITPKVLTINADADQSKVYGSADPVLTYAATGFEWDDDESVLTGALSRAPGEDVDTYVITQGTLVVGANYTIAYTGEDFAITAKALTVTADADQSKVYGSAEPVLTYATTGFERDDDEGVLTGALSREPGEDVDRYAITQGTLVVGSNYTISYTAADFTITPKTLAVTADAGQGKVYGSANPVLTYKAIGFERDDDASIFTGALSREVGEDVDSYAITQGTLSAGVNYTIAYTGTDFTITPKLLTVIADADQSKVYGSADPVLTYATMGFERDDDEGVLTGALAREPGEDMDRYAIIKGTLAVGSNYTISYTAADFTITPKTLTIIADAGQGKVYGSADPALTFEAIGFERDDDESILTGTLSRAPGEDADTYAITQGTLFADANYTIAYTDADFAITQKPLAVELNNMPEIIKVYDGTDAATLAAANYVPVGGLPGDDLAVSGTAAYGDKNAGTDKSIVVSDFELTGADAPNYRIITTSSTITGTITAKPLTVVLDGYPLITKEYDGTTAIVLMPDNYTLDGIVGDDEVTIKSTATYEDGNVGTEKEITVSGFVLGGADKANYTVAAAEAFTKGTITPKELRVALHSTPVIGKVYDGNDTATLAVDNYALGGVVEGDEVTITGTARYADTGVGDNKTVTVTDFVLGGAEASNYRIGTESATATGRITAGRASATHTDAEISPAEAGKEVTVTITARDAYGHPVTTVSPLAFTVSVSGANSAGMDVTDNGDGTYSAMYTPERGGLDELSIRLDGMAIVGSPYRYPVSDFPGAPTGLSATAGNRQVMLEWEVPADVFPAVADYMIEYSRDGGATWTVLDREPSAATRSLVIGLENNRTFLFRVSAVNGVGTGAASDPVQAIPTEPVPDGEGNLPEPAPGIPVVITDGKVEAVMLEVVDSEYLRLSGDGYALELASVGPDGERIPISAIDAVIRLLKGNGTQVYVSGNGFEPGTVVTVYLFSVPELVGHLPVAADGSFGGSLPVPADLELGRHTLQANGVVAGGNGQRSVSIGLELVDRRPQWVELGALADRTYGDDAVTLTATTTSGLPVSYTVTDMDDKPTDIASIANSNRLTIRGAGDIRITATQAGNADYSAAAPVSRTLHIAKARLAVRTADATRAYGEDNPVFEISYDGFVDGEDASALDTRPTAATDATTTTSAPGSYAITVSGGQSANYAFSYHGATLTITKADQSITLDAPAEVNRDAGSIQVDVSASSELPVTLSIDDEQVATVSGNTLNIHRLGTVTITATQTGDGNYEAAEPVTVTLRVTDPSSDFPIRVHQAVSPNGDGINEYLIIEGIRDHRENRVTVISRNGTVLWEASGYDNDRMVFRGISTAQQQLPAGTYFYIVEVKVNGKWEHRKGYFVIRY